MLIETTTVDGVPVLWTTTPGRLSATLYFRVGAADESYGTLGISHLVEHLAFDGEEDLDPDSNGSTNIQTTEFTVEGSPEKVRRLLERLCAALSAVADGSMPVESIEREKQVLIAEGGTALGEPAVGEALGMRFGLQAHGLAGVPSALLENLTAEEVRAWAGRYFTDGNAVLVLNGPPPEGLRLALPSGGRHAAPEPVVPVHDLPGEYATGGEELVLSFAVPETQGLDEALAGVVVTALERQSYRKLRRQSALIYGIEPGVAMTGSGGVFVCTVRVQAENAGRAAHALLGILRSLRDQGVEEGDLDAAVQHMTELAEDPQGAEGEVHRQGLSLLRGEPPLSAAQVAERMRTVTRQDVTRYLDRLEQTLLVGVPEEAYPQTPEPGTAGLVATLVGPVPGPEIHGKDFPVKLLARLSGAPRRLRLTVGEVGVSLSDGDFRQVQRWEDVVALEWGDPDPDFPLLHVVGRHGQFLEIPVAALKGGDEAVRLIQAKVPSRLHAPRRMRVTATSDT